MSFIFVSYSTENSNYASMLAHSLQSKGFDVWIDNVSIRSSENWWESIVEALHTCAAFVVVMTTESRASRWVQREVALADNLNKLIFPILLEGHNWEIFVLTQYEDVRIEGDTGPQYKGKLPSETFYQKLAEHAARKTDDGINLSTDVHKLADHVSTFHPAVDAEESLQLFFQQHIDIYDRQSWTDRKVELFVKDENGHRHSAPDRLLEWVSSVQPSTLVLVGDFGSGKTWLLRWLAREISGQEQTRTFRIPVIVPVARLFNKEISSFEDLLEQALPPLVATPPNTKCLVLFDGLDELLANAGNQGDQAFQYFVKAVQIVPNNYRILVSCRLQVFQQIRNNVIELFKGIQSNDVLDRSNIALNAALGQNNLVQILTICDVDQNVADSYLLKSKAKEVWTEVRSQSGYRELAQLPFTLYLLENALPLLAQRSATPSLPNLYRAAVDYWIARDHSCSQMESSKLYNHLEDIALSEMYWDRTVENELDSALLATGIIHETQNTITFTHYSMFEYFLARSVLKEMCEYSSRLLSRLNLVYMYNVNRFLVALLLNEIDDYCKRKVQSTNNKRLREAMMKVDIRTSMSTVNAIPSRTYFSFLQATEWRDTDGVGYGIWGTMNSPDNTLPYDGDDPVLQGILTSDASHWYDTVPSIESELHPVYGISWYDAFQFCRWIGGRLPTSDELVWLRSKGYGGHTYEWSSSWHDERQSQIGIVNMDLETTVKSVIQGMNPDLRSRIISFRVIFDN